MCSYKFLSFTVGQLSDRHDVILAVKLNVEPGGNPRHAVQWSDTVWVPKLDWMGKLWPLLIYGGWLNLCLAISVSNGFQVVSFRTGIYLGRNMYVST